MSTGGFKKWEHMILNGEFPERKRILEGLTVEQAVKQPAPGMHTIFEELWHAAGWAEIVINQDTELEKNWQVFPPKQAETQEEWDKLVDHFLSLLNKMIEFTSKPENINVEEEPGVTVEDYVDSLIMHNTYHLGKIVAIRQMIGAWTPLK